MSFEKKGFSMILLLRAGWGGKLSVSPDFSTLFNNCVYAGVFPDVLKIAKVIRLYKKGDRNSISNYRPILLLPVITTKFMRELPLF